MSVLDAFNLTYLLLLNSLLFVPITHDDQHTESNKRDEGFVYELHRCLFDILRLYRLTIA